MYTKSSVITLKDNKLENSRKEKAANVIQFVVNIGDPAKCPECRSTSARVVWVSQDKKTMGVKCPASHREANKPQSKFGATVIPSTKARKNLVFLTAVE